jgi:16S rRNA (uracil1498-N3)-methyltransferase
MRARGRAAIAEPRPLADWLAARVPGGLLVCLWEAEPRPLASQLPADVPDEAALVVGPEGGLTREEVEALRDAGAVVAGLGPRILRAETAGPVGLALLQARYGDLLVWGGPSHAPPQGPPTARAAEKSDAEPER